MQTHIHTDSFCLRHKIISFSICHRKTKLLFIDLYYGAFQQAPISLAQSIEIHIYIRLLCFSAFNPPRTHRLTPEELRFHIRTCSRNTRVGEREEGVGGVSLTAEMIGLSRRQLDVITSLITKVNRLKWITALKAGTLTHEPGRECLRKCETERS